MALRHWLEELFRQHAGGVDRYLQCRGMTQQDAAEVRQEAFAQVAKIKDPSAIKNVEAYLFSTVRNLVSKRKATATPEAALRIVSLEKSDAAGELVSPEPSTEEEICEAQRSALVAKWLKQLPQRQRDVWAMSLQGMTQREISKRLGVSKTVVERTLLAAMGALKRLASSDDKAA